MTVAPDPAQESNYLYYLSCVPLFKTVSPVNLASLARVSRWRKVQRGDFLFLQGDPAHAAFVICTGWVAIALNSADGRELAITEMRDGDLFGENALISGTARSTSAIAHAATDVLEIPRAAFLALLDDEPQLVRRMLEIAVVRLAASNHRESALAFLNAPARVARVLREMDEADRQTAHKGYVTLSQEEVAQRTGLTRQTVARFLGEWRRNGWLLTGRGQIELLNRAELLRVEEQSVF
ncbi:MAG: Crp/Fnr family transcriptional regulator [Candidatus Promineofilum sp.]|nr:Crp/Fnr family transcriptional regulator [Promineifilum sp.]